MLNFQHIPRTQFVTERRKSLQDADCEGGEWVAHVDCSPIALPLRSANAGTTHSAETCEVQVDVEEKIPFVAAVGQVPDKAGKEMVVGARHRFAPS
jgi:hypothetical protein